MGKGDAKELKVGIEFELFLLDDEGNVIFDADKVINLTKKLATKTYVEKECSTNVIELGCKPDPNPQESIKDMFKNVENLLVAAEKEGYMLLPLATYPGKFEPQMRKAMKYKVKRQIFGNEKWKIAGRVCGFHYHYQLPFNIPFIHNISVLQFLDLKYVHNMINGFNFMVALDPGLNCFLQSSPFYQGKHIGKDSRTIVYRGGKVLKYDDGMWAEHQDFGALPGYKYSIFEVMDMIREHFSNWKRKIKAIGINVKTFSLYGSTLDTAWNPVKINKLGTLEQRGSDMNHPQYIIAAAALIKYVMKIIYEEELVVTPSEKGNNEPFKIEGKILHVPLENHLINHLQVESAYKGFDDEKVYNYCQSLYQLGKKALPKDKKHLLDPFAEMLEKKMTVSDEIISFAKKKGWKKGQLLSDDIAKEIAKQHSSRLFKELVLARKYITDL